MKVLITGAAGFIGSALAIRLLARGDDVVGIDNHNDYYDPLLKESRIARHIDHPNYLHLRLDLINKQAIENIFNDYKPHSVINLAAQAGVRYSLVDPIAYVESNILGFAHILESCKKSSVEHLVYASSSSVYGANSLMPFSVHHNVDHPLSAYAASKKSNELMAHTYSHIYGLPTTGLRFFTVYGPWGRPDMALFKFTKAILNNEKIQVFNYGKHRRDFTYIDDVVECLIRAIDKPATSNLSWSGEAPDPGSSKSPWRIYNVGSHNPIKLLDYISALENSLGKKAYLELLPLQPGEVVDTYADVSDLLRDFNYIPTTKVSDGIKNFVSWYKNYYTS